MFKERQRWDEDDFCEGEMVRIHPLRWEFIRGNEHIGENPQDKYGGRAVRVYEVNDEQVYVDKGIHDPVCHAVPVRFIIKLESRQE